MSNQLKNMLIRKMVNYFKKCTDN